MVQGVPFLIVGTVVPHGAIVVALDEPDFVGSVRADIGHFAVVADQRFELVAEVVALDPVHHVAAKRGAGGDGAGGVDVGDVVAEVFEDFDEISVGCAAPVVLNLSDM